MFKNKTRKTISFILVIMTVVALMSVIFATTSFAEDGSAAPKQDAAVTANQGEQSQEEENSGSSTGAKAIGAGVAIGLAACGGALGMGILGGKSVEGISRQPEADGKIRTTLMLDLVFIETAIIYALLVVILIIFVL